MADRRGLVRIAIGVAIVALLVLLLAPPSRQVASDHRLSTLRTTPDGAGALYELLERLAVPVTRRMVPLTGLPQSGTGALAILRPTLPLSPAERDSLVAWVRQGGRLLAAPGPTDPLLAGFGVRAEWAPEREPDADALFGGGSGVSARPTPDPWTAGIDSVGPVWWTLEVDEASSLRQLEPLLLTGAGGLVAFRARFGEGRVVFISDPWLLTNERIAASGAAPLLARAAADLALDGPLAFDEYHHGHRGGSPSRAFFGFLLREPVGRVLLHLALVALLAGLPAAVRLGSPVPARVTPRRSPLEHVAALGEVYRQARAADLARRRLIVGFARRLGRERPPPGGEAAFLDRVARGAPAAADAVVAVGRGWTERVGVRELGARIDEALTRLRRAE